MLSGKGLAARGGTVKRTGSDRLRLVRTIAAAIAVVLSTLPCLAQTDPDFTDLGPRRLAAPDSARSGSPSPRLAHWSLTWSWGARDNLSHVDLLDGIEANGFADSQCEGWFGPCDYPWRTSEGGYKVLAVSYRRSRLLGLSTEMRWGEFASAGGLDEGSWSWDRRVLEIDTRLRMVSLLLEIHPTSVLVLCIGPVWGRLESETVWRDEWADERIAEETRANEFGIGYSIALRFPRSGPVFFQLRCVNISLGEMNVESGLLDHPIPLETGYVGWELGAGLWLW